MPAAPPARAPESFRRVASLRTVIEAASAELLSLASEVHRLQALIGDHVAALGSREGAVEDAQLLDVLLQHHEALSEVLKRLAAEVPDSAEVRLDTVLGPLRLSGLADRLAGAETTHAKTSGELEMF
jgi:hypothetical protein